MARIPIHDHRDINSGGRLKASSALSGGATAVSSSSSSKHGDLSERSNEGQHPASAVTYGGHVGTDVDAALDGRPPTHTSASDPTTGDDSGDGHIIGCRWINTATDEEFVVTDVSVGAAVWQSTTSGSGGSVDVTDGTTTVSPADTIDFDPTYFNVTAPGGGVAEVTFVGTGGGVTVEDEGTPLSTVADTLDFVGAGVTASGSGTTKTITIPGGGGASYGQVIDYPTSFTGDVIDGSSTTPFADVAAFDTKQVLNSRILHLQTLGANKAHDVRVTLGTTKAGAFDVRACMSCINQWYGANTGDAYTSLRLSTSADAQLAEVRFYNAGDAITNRHMILRCGGSGMSGGSANAEPWFAPGTDVTLRITRDGSDVIRFYYGLDKAPTALVPILRQQTGNYGEEYTETVSGTLARIQIAHRTPTGPGSTYQVDTFVDYVASV
jgi:hypothetical protein